MKTSLFRLSCSTLSTVCFAASLSALPGLAAPVESNIVFPANAGVLNVRDAKYGARGDGKTDDTAAIQKALTEGLRNHRVVYLPNGVYLVSDTLKWQNVADAGNDVKGWGPFLQMQGQSRSKTIVRLKEGAEGFGDEETPKAVIATGSSGSHGGKKYNGGEGNEAFENHLRDFTVETGKGNEGAVGIDWQASNCGAMRHVSVRGGGYCGIGLTRRDNGPGLIKDVSVEGFRFGIRTFQEIAHFTLEDIDLSGQSEAGLWIRDSVVGARHIRSRNSVPAIQMAGVSILSLFDSDFKGGAGAAAINCQGTEPRLYVRNLKTAGYAGAVKVRGALQKTVLTEWSSDAPLGNAQGKLSLGLPIRDTPEWYDSNPKNWADAGEPSGGDDTAQVQAALDSGKSTIFFRYGRYFISDTLVVPPGVKRIQGTGSQLTVKTRMPDDKPMLRFAGGKATDLTIIDRFECSAADGPIVEHLDARTLVLTDLLGSSYRNQRGAGPLFIEDVVAGDWRFAPGTQAWGRQWNIEGGAGPLLTNDGATIWVLGLKNEGGGVIVENKNGARTELWSVLAYTFGVPADRPALVNTDASLAVQLGGMTYMGASGYYDLLVRNTQKGTTTELRRAATIGRGSASTIPLYVSMSRSQPPIAAPIVAQTDVQGEKMNAKKLAATIAVTGAAVAPPATTIAKADTPAVKTATTVKTGTTAKTYKAPEFFDGEENGKSTGNPIEVGGKPMWAAMQIWPDDIFKRENYKPMNWAGDSWRGAYEYGGQPAVTVSAGNIDISSRGAWGGGGVQDGNKRGALVFTAPAKGIYKVVGSARAFVWEGDKAAGANLTLLKHDPKTGKITRVKQVATPNETVVPIEDAEVELEAGQELIFLNAVNSMYTASATALNGLKLEFAPTSATTSTTAAASTSPVKIGQSVEISGKTYKVTKVEGKTITLQAQ